MPRPDLRRPDALWRGELISGLAPFFDGHLFSAYTLGVWKPDPALYRQAGEAMGFAPNECVVIDDAAVGVVAGLEAGMHVVHLNRFPMRKPLLKGQSPFITPASIHPL